MAVGCYFFYTYNQYKQYLAESISQQVFTLHNGMEKVLDPIIDADSLNLIQPILSIVPKNRPFVKTISLSLDNRTILFSSDTKLVGKPLPQATWVHNNVASEIIVGKTSFLIPLTYFHKNQKMTGSLLLTLNPNAISSNVLLHRIYRNFILSTIFIIFITGIILIIIHRYIFLPLKEFDLLSYNKHQKLPHFFIKDLSDIYVRLVTSYNELESKERSLETALMVKEHLHQILQTIDLVERLLISDKSIQEIMEETCELLSHYGQYNLAWIGNIIDDRIDIVAHSKDPTGYVDQLSLSLNPEDPTSQGPSAQSIITNQTVLTQSVNLPYYTIWRNKAKASGIGSSLCIPIRGSANEKPFATLTIYSSKPLGFLNEEITMLEDLAGNLGYSIVLRMKKNELQTALTTDSLTNLPNRSLLLSALDNQIHPQLLLININRFSDINTVYGFDAGDFVLRSCAECLRIQITEDIGNVYKLHSDTYAILFNTSNTTQTAEILITNVAAKLAEQAFFYKGIEIFITIAGGYSDTHEQTIENAEIALKSAKEHRILFKQFDPSMRSNQMHEDNIKWYKIIKDALKEERLFPFYQPIVNNDNGDIVKYEALARITMQDGSVIAPFKFLHIAKKTGLYPQLTQTIVKKTIETLTKVPYRISLNLSTEDMSDAKMVSFLHDSIAQSTIGTKIVFEILESEGINNYDLVSDFINEFKQLGCQFAIDDFGSGYSNFEHLIKLQVDFLKIDGSLIKNLPHDKNAQVIVRNIQNFAAEMGIATIAEFVSSKEIFEMVKAMGITYSQGYYFSEPLKEIIITK